MHTGLALAMGPGIAPTKEFEWDGVTWEVGRRLGEGKFAAVYECACPGRTTRVAAKFVDRSRLSPWAQAQLNTEIEVCGYLRHPHITHFHGSLRHGRYTILLLELSEGGELFERIVEKDSFRECDAARLMRQLLSAVSYLHSKRIAHRDLKPENLLLDSEEDDANLRVADFGSCKVFKMGDELDPMMASTPCGSMGYAAPEQIRQQLYEHQCDLWSAGVIAYVLLSGCMPFDPSTYAGSSFTLTFPDHLWSSTSTDAVDFIKQLLQVDPHLRPTAQQALAHRWLTCDTPLPSQLPTPRCLQVLKDSGHMADMFHHANEVWMYSCATTPIGPSRRNSVLRTQKTALVSPSLTDGQEQALANDPEPLGHNPQAIFVPSDPVSVPILTLPAHLHKRRKTDPNPATGVLNLKLSGTLSVPAGTPQPGATPTAAVAEGC
mmetsp:Transcript_3603/g.10593  ORF Transcript_3603/g.10593 Transcript_3603/m.10593 type:complete len:434 (+) Transcript_3603:49-1350(+)